MGRKVSFVDDDFMCEFHEGAVMDTIDSCAADIWYQQNDLSQMKRKAVIVSKEAHKHGLGSLLSNTYGRSGPDVQVALEKWAMNGNSRRGLERWINDEYAAKRSDIRRRTIQSVLRAQDKMNNEGVKDSNYSVKVLSRLSEAFSLDSANFARYMGLADEKAANADGGAEEAPPSTMNGVKSDCHRSLSNSGGAAPPRKNLGLSSSVANMNGAVDMRHFY
jgi:hypothetical protein